MSELEPETSPAQKHSSQEQSQSAEKFAEVTAGVYRRFDAESVWTALRYSVTNQLHRENPTIMLMFVRIAEVYAESAALLRRELAESQGEIRQAIELILAPPPELRQASYLPSEIDSPGEMDLCWSEFLVTGETDVVRRVVAVLDRDDRTRVFLRERLDRSDHPIGLDDQQRGRLQHYGIGIGKLSGDDGWDVMTHGDTDIFLWLGVKDRDPTCLQLLQHMDDDLKLHVANKGAALWSLQANASQHGKIRMLCEEASRESGGFARQLLQPG